MDAERAREIDQALQTITDPIWSKGEITDGRGCLVPSDYAFEEHFVSEFHRASDILYKEFKATHYSRTWLERGVTIQVDLYEADAFGAAIDLNYITTFYVKVKV